MQASLPLEMNSLIGQVIDTNSAWLARALNPIGISIQRRLSVGDDPKGSVVQSDEMFVPALIWYFITAD